MSDENVKKAVNITEELYTKIEERAKETGFGSVEEYVNFVMEEVLKDDDEEQVTFSKEEEEEVKKRLKALGYLD